MQPAQTQNGRTERELRPAAQPSERELADHEQPNSDERRSPLSVSNRPPSGVADPATGGRLAYERAIRRSSLPPGARHVALTVATWADMGSGVIPHRFQPSLSTLAEATGLGKSSIKRNLTVLEEGGWLIRERPDAEKARTEHARTAYRLHVPEGARPTVGLGPDGAQPRSTVGLGHGPEWAEARPVVGHKSPLNSLSAKSSSLSSPPPEPEPAEDEREIIAALPKTNDQDDPAKVADAWHVARGRGRNPAAESKVRDSAVLLMSSGWSIPDLVALAEDMARRQPAYTDLAKHEPHWVRPKTVAALPPWCGNCDGEPLAERWINTEKGAYKCPDCNPYVGR